MSVVALITAAIIWAFFVWVIFVMAAARSESLTAKPAFWLLGISISICTPLLAAILIVMSPQTIIGGPVVYTASSSFKSISAPLSLTPNLFIIAGLIIYIGGVAALLLNTAAAYYRLMKIARVKPSSSYKNINVITTDKHIPPCSFGFMRPKIIMPRELCAVLTKAETDMICEHERGHILHHDQRVYLLLLILKAAFWPQITIANFIHRWQVASELRADSFALNGKTQSQRTEYGKMLLGVLRKKSGGTLPCPSATLHLSNYRSAKMRVINIMNPKQFTGKRHSKKVSVGAAALLLSGAIGISALASEGPSPDKNAQPVKRYPPIFPVNCPVTEGIYAAKVKLKFDVDKKGHVENVRVTDSTNPCFNNVSVTSVRRWAYKTNTRKLKNVETMLTYKQTK